MASEKLIGKISHFFNNISVGIIELTDKLAVGDKIHIKGHTTDFEQTIDSMQSEHKEIAEAGAGQAIGTKVAQKIKEGDEVFKVSE
ncbi:MAG: translation elongation factor-like protein [Candidatus Portnoybacteria bacterium]|nr:translation elongation factor-like protein [Candidatus Portnoybacteria bacterium]